MTSLSKKTSRSIMHLAHEFQVDELRSNQESLEQAFLESQSQNTLKNFMKLKYKGLIYKCGEFIELYNIQKTYPSVARLMQIVQIHGRRHKDAGAGKYVIEVQWYMRKEDIETEKYKEFQNCLSNAEVFASGVMFYLDIESILGKCEVLSLNEYSIISLTEDGIYFTRSRYDCQLKTLTPPPEKWKKICVCQLPYNPDLEYIQCEKCQQWFHLNCVFSEYDQENNFECRGCSKFKTEEDQEEEEDESSIEKLPTRRSKRKN